MGIGTSRESRHGRQSVPRGICAIVVVADTERSSGSGIYLKHLRNFYSKSLYVAPHLATSGFMTKRSSNSKLSHRGASAFSFDFQAARSKPGSNSSKTHAW